MSIIDELRGFENETNLVHLHVHTEYSFLDGFNKAKDAAKRAKELGMKAIAITDHNHTSGVIDFQAACKKENIKPILGCEMYYTWDTNILSLPKEDRDEWAIARAKEAGVDIDTAIYNIEHPISEKTGRPLKGKKITKGQLNELIAPYSYDTKQYHIILLAINQTGWNNLVKLQSEASRICTFNARYCCDDAMLEMYNEGLIMTTACIGNSAASLINKGEHERAENQIDRWHAIFQDRFYLEIQPLLSEDQFRPNLNYMEYAKQKGIKLIATTDVHYTYKEDYDDHDTLICVGIGKVKNDPERQSMRYEHQFWIKSYDEMIETFGTQAETIKDLFGEIFDESEYMENVRQALINTNTIADLIQPIELGSSINLFPNIEIPDNRTPEQYLVLQCYRKLYQYKNMNPDINIIEYEKRLHYELSVINAKGFAPYILVVQDYIDWANNNNCPTGPGRGSCAGSLAMFLLGITKMIDPIKYGLLFFRFLTMDRTAPPDIDTDFEYFNRERVIDYLKFKYGYNCVANIGTNSEMGIKSGIRDVGRVLEINYGVVNEISKRVDTWLDKPDLCFADLDRLKDSDRSYEKAAWADFNKCEQEYPDLFRLVRRFEGVVRNHGIHASGILITPIEVNSLFPIRYKDGIAVTLYTGTQLEDLKAIKFDILGLKTLSVIKETLKSIDESLSMEDIYRVIDVDDPEIFKMICDKKTDGLFQIESGLFKGMIEEIKPNSMNDIIVINSLGRPGPLSAGMDKSYASRKQTPEKAVEPLPGTWDVVSDTYGTICYQEQIMIIAKIVAGFNDNQSDSYLRKAFAKKQKAKMIQCRQWFIYGKVNINPPEDHDGSDKNQVDYDPNNKYGPPIIGGINNGYDEIILSTFWANIEGFADYLFNKSHAACYSYITMLTAFLKCYHPAKFMAALMTIQDGGEKIDTYCKVSRSMRISMLAPDINISDKEFIATDDNTIYYGLASIKGVGDACIKDICDNRPYDSIADLMARVPKKSINKRVIIALAKAGCFDAFEPNRFAVINNIYTMRGDTDEEILIPEAWNSEECIQMEKDILGTAITYIPFWDNVEVDEKVTINLKIKTVAEKVDKKGNLMAFLTGTFESSTIECVIFSSTYCKSKGSCDKSLHKYITVKGKKDSAGKLIVSSIVSNDEPDNIARDEELDSHIRDII